MQICFTISNEFSGLRLDQALAVHLPVLSRSGCAALVQAGQILVDGKAVKKPSLKVRTGQSVTGTIPEETPVAAKPLNMELPILFEDEYILIIDKPPGLVVHPGPGHSQDTLVNGLLAHDPLFGDAHWDSERPGIVHRLDQETSGLLLIAKTPHSLAFLQREFKERRVEKHYLALVIGQSIPDSGEIEKPIGRHPRKRKLMAVVPETGKYARTGFVVRRRFKGAALLEVRLHTGRTHQIRVHFYDQGMPLLGDQVYQTRQHRKAKSLAPRQMLHSWRLSFRHPHSGRRLDFEAPMPHDFLFVMDQLEPLFMIEGKR